MPSTSYYSSPSSHGSSSSNTSYNTHSSRTKTPVMVHNPSRSSGGGSTGGAKYMSLEPKSSDARNAGYWRK